MKNPFKKVVDSNLDILLLNSPLKDYDRSPKLNSFTLPTLGLGYIATCAEVEGFTAEVLDAEALGLGISEIAHLVNSKQPRWLGLNLLAPTFPNSIEILRNIDQNILVMLGEHQAKAMPLDILMSKRIPRIDALVLGEGETRVPHLLADINSRKYLPKVYWRSNNEIGMAQSTIFDPELLEPDLDKMPFLDRKHLVQDPYWDDGYLECLT